MNHDQLAPAHFGSLAALPWQTAFKLGLFACVVAFIASAASFLRLQSIWIDETTQLSGMALGVQRLFPWLMGHGPDLGVPADRMPPLSYLLGMLWGAVGGLSEAGSRWFGLTCSVAAVVVTACAARRASGPVGGLVAVAFLAVSPTVLVYAPEIRAYPVFFMLSSMATYAFVRTLQADAKARAGWLAGLTVVLLLAVYTHYFGVILACSVIAALLVDALRFRKPIRPLVIAATALAVLSAGIVPFVMAAMSISGGGEAQPIVVREVLVRASKLVYRFYGHPALAGSVVMTIVASAGFGALLIGGLLAVRRSGRVEAGLVVAAALGAAMVLAAAFRTRGFDTLAPHYNFWMVPIVALLLAQGAVWLANWRAPIGLAAVAMLLIGCCYSTFLIHARPGAYAHGPQRQIIAKIDGIGAGNVDVVYDATDGGAPGHIVFPLRYRYGRSLPQYTVEKAGNLPAPFDTKDPVPAQPARSLVLVISAHDISAADLAAKFRAADLAPGALPVAEALKQHGWRSISRDRYLGLVTADVELLQKAP